MAVQNRRARMHPASILAAATLGCAACSEPATRPHVLLVSIDTLRADHLSCYGYARETSPFLDQLARRGILFERAFSSAPWTLPAHLTMLTGLFPAQHGVVEEELALARDVPLLAERLSAAGYATLGLYRPSWIHARHGFARGFDVFRGHETVEEARAHALEELAKLDPARPTFLFLHLFDVHNGALAEGEHMLYASPPPYQDLFLPGAAELLPEIPPDVLWEGENLLDARGKEAIAALYDGGIRHVDANLAELFGELERDGWLTNALVLVTSDHGESLAQRGKLTGHGELAQEGLHVPLIVVRPDGTRAGERVRELVHLGDIVPTVLAAAGLGADARLPGRSLFGELAPGRVASGTYLPNEFAVRWPEKLIHRRGGSTVAFDLERDPLELAPRAVKSERYEELLRAAHPAGSPFGPPTAISLTAEDAEDLRALGYGGEDE